MGQSYDLETVIEAAAILAEEGIDFNLKLARTNPKEEVLKEMVRKLRLKEHVRFHGYLAHQELKALLAGADVALSPIFDDSWIAFPYKVSDYLCAGLPVINNLAGEVRALLEEHEAGFWYPAKNVTALAECMKLYCLDRDMVRRHGENARRFAAEQLDRSITYPKLAEFLEGMIGEEKEREIES